MVLLRVFFLWDAVGRFERMREDMTTVLPHLKKVSLREERLTILLNQQE